MERKPPPLPAVVRRRRLEPGAGGLQQRVHHETWGNQHEHPAVRTGGSDCNPQANDCERRRSPGRRHSEIHGAGNQRRPIRPPQDTGAAARSLPVDDVQPPATRIAFPSPNPRLCTDTVNAAPCCCRPGSTAQSNSIFPRRSNRREHTGVRTCATGITSRRPIPVRANERRHEAYAAPSAPQLRPFRRSRRLIWSTPASRPQMGGVRYTCLNLSKRAAG